MIISFTVQMEPVAKGRAQWGRFGTYTPEKTRTAENTFQTLAMRYKPAFTLKTALRVSLTFWKSIPTSLSGKKRDLAILGKIMPTGRPDTDNFAKLVLDAMNGHFYEDDSQIVKLECEKRYAETPMIAVIIETIE